MKKILSAALCAVILCGLLTGCMEEKGPYLPTGNGLHVDQPTQVVTTQKPAVEQTLSLTYYPDRSLNPYQAADYTNRVLLPLVYQGLFQVNGDYSVEAILCSRYTVSRDAKIYTFYLEETARFSDGVLLTAQDVKASLEAAMAGPVYGGRLGYVESISILEDGGIQISLTTSYENLPLLLDVPIVKAAEVNAPRPLGTGPYRYDEHITGLRLVRSSLWWCKANLQVTASYIPLVEAKSNAHIRDQFEFGNVSLVCADPGSDLYVDYHSDYELWAWENNIFLYLGCNEKSKIFSDAALRQALTHAIDRDALIESYYRGFALPATLPTSPTSPYYNKGLAARYDYDKEVFAQAVANAQLENPAVTILVNKSDSRRCRVAREIAKMLTECGLNATTSELSGEKYTNALKKGEYDLHLGQTILSATMDLTAFYSTTGALCYGGMSNATILAICREALANSGNYYTLYQMVMDDAMLCPILFRSYAIYTERGVFEEFSPTRDSLFYYSLGKSLEDVYES